MQKRRRAVLIWCAVVTLLATLCGILTIRPRRHSPSIHVEPLARTQLPAGIIFRETPSSLHFIFPETSDSERQLRRQIEQGEMIDALQRRLKTEGAE